jgi:hypothetical protein
MRKSLALAGLLVGVLSGLSVPAMAKPLTVEITVEPTHIRTELGDEFTIETEIRNTGDTNSGPLLAHLNVASIDDSVYVDPEDWSSERSQQLSLQPGESRKLSWELQAVNSGRLAAYVVVLPATKIDTGQQDLVVTPLVRLEVAPRATLTAAGALPVVLGVPLLLGLAAAGARYRTRRRTWQRRRASDTHHDSGAREPPANP